jgi:uncharacterized protein involved in cysteine biosynthesis
VNWLKLLEIAFVAAVLLSALGVFIMAMYLHLIARKEEDDDDVPN